MQGNTFTFLFIFGCLLSLSWGSSSIEEIEDTETLKDLSEDLSEDLTSMESQRSARFLRWPSPSRKVRIKKRLGPYPGALPPTLDPSKAKMRLHVKQPVMLAKRPMRSNPMVYKKVARKGPLGVKLPPRGPVPSPKRPRKMPLPLPPKGLKSPKVPPKAIYKKKLKQKTPGSLMKNPAYKKPYPNKKVVPAQGLEKPVINEVNKRVVPSQAGIVPTKHQKKQGVVADERFFFPARGKRRPRPSKKKPKKRPSKYRRPKPKPKPQPVYKPKPTKKPKKPKTTKAPVYKPQPITDYPSEITSYKPPKDVYNPSSNVDTFPEFSKPNFPDLSSTLL